jgi:thioredoxin 1
MNTQSIKRLGLIFAVACLAVALVMVKREGGTLPGTSTAGLPRLVELGATACIPCQQMKPILDGLERDYAGQFAVEFIHVYDEAEKAEPYQIRLMPTQVFLAADGRELYRHEGFFARAAILEKWEELGYDFTPVAPPDDASTNAGSVEAMTAEDEPAATVPADGEDQP